MERLRYFRNTIHQLRVLTRGDRVVIGVSGGADSLTLMHLLAHFRDDLHIDPYVVHVHHGIRGEEADADAVFVSASADQMGIARRVMYADVPKLAHQHKLTLEEAARKARYTLLAEVANEVGAKIIAVAHNADDQAETVLMHLLRGSGLAGMRGMLAVTPFSESHLFEGASVPDLQIIRPLLDYTRAEIEEYCIEHHLHPRVDSTNIDTSYTRNRIRHDIMPLLESINPNLKRTLGRTSKILAADYEFIEEAVDRVWADVVVETTPDYIRFNHAMLPSLPLSVRRGLLLRGIHVLDPDSSVNFEWVDSAAGLISRVRGGSMQSLFGRIRLVAQQNEISLVLNQKYVEPNFPLMAHPNGIRVSDIGIYWMMNGEWVFSLQTYNASREGGEWQSVIADRWSAVLDADLLPLPLHLRERKHGDRFYPQGAGGSQKLSDFLINVKFPKMWRDALPLLVNRDDEIVWVPGYRVDERFVVKPETKAVWLARFEKMKEG